MKSTVRSTLLTRLDMLRASIPDVAPCRTKRGRVRKCIRFVEVRRRVEQLYETARTRPQRRLVDNLIAEIERRRDEVADEQAYERFMKAKKQRLRYGLERYRPWFEGSSSRRPRYPGSSGCS